MSGNNVRLGILSGGGRVPEEIASAAVARGWFVHVVGIDGEVDGRFPGLAVTRVNWGQVGRMRRLLQRQIFGQGDDAPGITTVLVDALNIVQDRIARSRLAGDPPDAMITPRLHVRGRV